MGPNAHAGCRFLYIGQFYVALLAGTPLRAQKGTARTVWFKSCWCWWRWSASNVIRTRNMHAGVLHLTCHKCWVQWDLWGTTHVFNSLITLICLFCWSLLNVNIIRFKLFKLNPNFTLFIFFQMAWLPPSHTDKFYMSI